jgi:hypothetical protein
MFESILEKVLQRTLGDYLEGLDKKNLSLGVYCFFKIILAI